MNRKAMQQHGTPLSLVSLELGALKLGDGGTRL